MTDFEKKKESYYPILDWVRFLSAFLVMLGHFTYNNTRAIGVGSNWAPIYNGWFDYYPLSKFASIGSIGVDFFFIISGFVISQTITKGLSNFVMNRFLRIYPTLWVFASISFLCTFFATQINGENAILLWLKSISLFPIGPWVDGVYWTLVVELIFYGMVFFSWYFLLEKGLIFLMYSLTVISLLGVALLFIAEFNHIETLKLLILSYKAKPLMLTTGQAFAFGMALQYLVKDGLKLRHVLCASISGTITFFWIYHKASQSMDPQALVPMVLFLTFLVYIALFVGIFGKLKLENNFLSISKLLGKATYPIYLFHNIAGSLVLFFLVKVGLNIWLALLFSMLFVIILCCLFVQHIELKIVFYVKKILESFLIKKIA